MAEASILKTRATARSCLRVVHVSGKDLVSSSAGELVPWSTTVM
jgi:hypothetical protein